MRWSAALCIAVMGLVSVAAGCGGNKPGNPKTDDDPTDQDHLPSRARIRVVHASPDAGSITIFATTEGGTAEQLFDGAALGYTAYSGPQSVEADVATVIEARRNDGTTLFAAPATTFGKDKTYLVVLAGYAVAANKPVAEAQSLAAIVLEDGLKTPDAGYAQIQVVNAMFDVSQTGLGPSFVLLRAFPAFSFPLAFGRATPMGGTSVTVRDWERLAIFTAESIDVMYTIDIGANDRFTIVAVGNRAAPQDGPDALQLILVPAAGTTVSNASPVLPDATIYFLHAYPNMGPVGVSLNDGLETYHIDQDRDVYGFQPTALGQVTPRWFVSDKVNLLDVAGFATGDRTATLPEMPNGTVNVFALAGFPFPGSNQQPLTEVGPIPLTPLAGASTASVTIAQAGSDADGLTFTLTATGFSKSTAVNFGGYDNAMMSDVPAGTDVSLHIAEASFDATFQLLPATRYVLISYGIAAPSGYSFACALLPFAPNGALGAVVTLTD